MVLQIQTVASIFCTVFSYGLQIYFFFCETDTTYYQCLHSNNSYQPYARCWNYLEKGEKKIEAIDQTSEDDR